MANFLTEFVNDKTGLPEPSYDLWEQTFLTSTYTTALTCAALFAASELAVAANDQANSIKWRLAANDIKMAAQKYLYNPAKKVFYRGIHEKDNQIIFDDVVDCSSVFGPYIYGLFDADSDEIKESINTIKGLFGINNGEIGLPRYENDEYRRVSPGITGNKWFVTSLWLAQYYIDQGNTDDALSILDWVRDQSLSTGVMAEQFDPISKEIVSPAPLTWSHAEYVATLLDLASKKLDKK